MMDFEYKGPSKFSIQMTSMPTIYSLDEKCGHYEKDYEAIARTDTRIYLCLVKYLNMEKTNLNHDF